MKGLIDNDGDICWEFYAYQLNGKQLYWAGYSGITDGHKCYFHNGL